MNYNVAIRLPGNSILMGLPAGERITFGASQIQTIQLAILGECSAKLKRPVQALSSTIPVFPNAEIVTSKVYSFSRYPTLIEHQVLMAVEGVLKDLSAAAPNHVWFLDLRCTTDYDRNGANLFEDYYYLFGRLIRF